MKKIEVITGLSHEFGTADYVKGGGGNTSVKNATTLWVKPSGTTLAGMTPGGFVALERRRIAELYAVAPPRDAAGRETLVKEIMQAAVRADSVGRPSVEAPLHDSFTATYVVHTHPPLVNGMTCGHTGAEIGRKLFPEALWMEYVDPGYTLCLRVRAALQRYAEAQGRQPAVVFIENHGVFVAGETATDIRRTYGNLMSRLGAHCVQAGVDQTLAIGPAPTAAAVRHVADALRVAGGGAPFCVRASGPFAVAAGPITPDHIVYMKSYPFCGEPTPAALAAFSQQHGYTPRVVATPGGVYGIGASEKAAALALELAQDGALVAQLARAFGGIRYLGDAARDFIDNWEVEAYRRKQMA